MTPKYLHSGACRTYLRCLALMLVFTAVLSATACADIAENNTLDTSDTDVAATLQTTTARSDPNDTSAVPETPKDTVGAADSSHTHDFVFSYATSPSCTELGRNYYTCSCGDVQVETTADALGHDIVAATCAEGSVCRRCGVSFSARLGHTYGEWQTYIAAGCETRGEDRRTCSRCGDTDTRQTEPIGHVFENGICTGCGIAASNEGMLDFQLNDDAASYTVVGIGNFSGADVIIPSTHNGLPVIGIADAAFENVQSICSVTLHVGIKRIGNHAFFGCSSLKSINIPDGVTALGMGVFANCALESIVLPDSVIELGTHLFSGCSSLTAAALGDGITYISDSMFTDCTALRGIDFPRQLTAIGADAFMLCRSLTSITLPQNVSAVGNNAFSYCTSLTVADLSGCRLKKLSLMTFVGCGVLTRVKLGAALEQIDIAAFGGCAALKTIDYSGTAAQWSEITSAESIFGPGAAITVHCQDGDIAIQH